ncbi:hypothetical protein P43SY_009617 [Pythium insidiosum]|uniref:Uncharacterized protein n=1 Tax=Pythium insidiosum TaxID=114742 RepID=A0AAD5QB50_PYTIN|nr:hypothetical protein P43SY_009617 [Pythium insidiosum]
MSAATERDATDSSDDSGDVLQELAAADAELARWRARVLERVGHSLRSLDGLLAAAPALVVLNLAHNAIEDLSPLAAVAPTLQLANLSSNALRQLPPAPFWARFEALTVLFLSGNELRAWPDLEGLAHCRRLEWLTLDGNPFMSLINAREFLVNRLPPSLLALNDHVVTDIEFIRHAGRSLRFGAQNVRLYVGELLEMPPSFAPMDDAAGDDAGSSQSAAWDRAQAYLRRVAATLRQVFARNSPSVMAQRVVRGHLSRAARVPRLSTLRALVTRVQKLVRGFLFRRRLLREFVALVHAQGKSHLLTLRPGPAASVDAQFLLPVAQRGLRQLLTHVQRWRARFRAKKQAIALKKIRFWCQMVYQRYRYRSAQLLREQHEICIYYTAEMERDVLELALKAVPRDPVLAQLPADERDSLLRERCVAAGVSVLRSPTMHRELTPLAVASVGAGRRPRHRRRPRRRRYPRPARDVSEEEAAQEEEDDDDDDEQGEEETGESEAEQQQQETTVVTPPLVRIFRSDDAIETNVLIAQKHALQRALERLEQRRKSLQSAPLSARGRAELLHIPPLTHEMQQRLANVNRKLVAAVIKQQQLATAAPRRLSLCPVAIRPRGHVMTRFERKKWLRLAAAARRADSESHAPTSYARMRAFLPWSIDMYLQMTTALERRQRHNASARFALPYLRTRRLHAAVTIQSAWRASRQHNKRNALEVAIVRALTCLQRWWRWRRGVRRRLAFLARCVAVGAGIQSATLFLEEPVFRLLSDASRWAAVQNAMRPCREHALNTTMAHGTVQIALSPTQLLLVQATRDSGAAAAAASRLEAASSARCGGYFPLWLPGIPEQREESMVSRSDDATPLLLVERVHVEPTVLEREILLGLTTAAADGDDVGGCDAVHATGKNPFQAFAQGRQVAACSAQMLALTRQLAPRHNRRWRLQGPLAAFDATSFVRLTFESVEEARRRALVLLAKTYDPVSQSFARLYSLETLCAALLQRHQWAVTQALGGDAAAAQRVLTDAERLLQPTVPCPWLLHVSRRLPDAVLLSPAPSPSPQPSPLPSPPPSPSYSPSHSPVSSPTRLSPQQEALHGTPSPAGGCPHRPMAHSPERVARSSETQTDLTRPAPLHIAEPVPGSPSSTDAAPTIGILPVPPPPRSRCSPVARGSRHQLLTDRLGRPAFSTLHDMQETALEDRELLVRELREERERAMEAMIVDRRMLQREHAAELAGIHLEMHVKLQKLRYERELEKIGTRELIERERMNSHHRKLVRQVERAFVAQSGAMMRRAARQAVETRREERAEASAAQHAVLKQREAEALERRRDAKSYWFVNNQQAKRDVHDRVETGLEAATEKRQARVSKVRQRIKEDKEIKQLLRLV